MNGGGLDWGSGCRDAEKVEILEVELMDWCMDWMLWRGWQGNQLCRLCSGELPEKQTGQENRNLNLVDAKECDGSLLQSNPAEGTRPR